MYRQKKKEAYTDRYRNYTCSRHYRSLQKKEIAHGPHLNHVKHLNDAFKHSAAAPPLQFPSAPFLPQSDGGASWSFVESQRQTEQLERIIWIEGVLEIYRIYRNIEQQLTETTFLDKATASFRLDVKIPPELSNLDLFERHTIAQYIPFPKGQQKLIHGGVCPIRGKISSQCSAKAQ